MRWAGYVACMGEKINAYRILVGKPGRKRPLWIPKRDLEDNIYMRLTGIGWCDMDWINLAQDRNQRTDLVKIIMKLRVQCSVGKFWSSWATGGFSRRTWLHGVTYYPLSGLLHHSVRKKKGEEYRMIVSQINWKIFWTQRSLLSRVLLPNLLGGYSFVYLYNLLTFSWRALIERKKN
jgi:hypothetical protein